MNKKFGGVPLSIVSGGATGQGTGGFSSIFYLPFSMQLGSVVFFIIYFLFFTDMVLATEYSEIEEGNRKDLDKEGFNEELPTAFTLASANAVKMVVTATSHVNHKKLFFGMASENTLSPINNTKSEDSFILCKSENEDIFLKIRCSNEEVFNQKIGSFAGHSKITFEIYFESGKIRVEEINSKIPVFEKNFSMPSSSYIFTRSSKVVYYSIMKDDEEVLVGKADIFTRFWALFK